MILEDATHGVFGYWPSRLKSHCAKPILATCDGCDKVRITSKHNYCPLCRSCALKGKNVGDKNGMFGKTGDLNPFFGKQHTEEVKLQMSAAHRGKHHTKEHNKKMHIAMAGENNPNFGKRGKAAAGYRGGKKLAQARSKAKRRRLGCTLLMPLKEGEVGHHVTDEYVIGILKKVHEQFSGYSCKNHRQFVLEWLKNNDKRKYTLVLIVLGKNSYPKC